MERQDRTTNDQREKRDDQLDETIDESFPASDAPANTVETGVGVGEVVADDSRTPVQQNDSPEPRP